MKMEITRQNGNLKLSGFRELNSTNAQEFRESVAAALTPGIETIEVDFAQTQNVDGSGLGALVWLYETVINDGSSSKLVLRLTNPAPQVQQIIELTRLHHVFEVQPVGSKSDAPAARAKSFK